MQNNAPRRPREPQEFDEKVVRISRVSKKTKGGNKMGFTALVVVGDRKGRVGVALAHANDVMNAIKKAVRRAKKTVVKVPLVDNRTIAHQTLMKYGASQVLLKPAPVGTGVIAGGSVRAVLELAGVRDVVAKTLGTNNKLTNVTATFEALKMMQTTVTLKEALGQMPAKKSVAPQIVAEAPKEQKELKSPKQPKLPKQPKSKKETK